MSRKDNEISFTSKLFGIMASYLHSALDRPKDSNHASWYMSNGYVVVRLPTKPQKSVADINCPVPTCFLELERPF
jgi:hypothetical protein